MQRSTRHDLRCTCRHTPKLGEYGLDNRGKPYLHIKVWKGDRLYAEVIFRGGEAKILCRECLRWYRVVFQIPRSHLEPVETPPELVG